MLTDLDPQQFAREIDALRREPWIRPWLDAAPNFWDIVEYGQDSYEIRQSRMLLWLLDPQGNHGTGSAFARAVVECAHKAGPTACALWRGTEDEPRGNINVYAEYPVRVEFAGAQHRGRLDLLYLDHGRRRYLAIENKTGSTEHGVGGSTDVSQLQAYSTYLAQAHPGYAGVHVYLAPEGDTTDEPGWVSVSHQSLFDAYDTLAEQTSADARKIITDFRVDLSRKLDRTADVEAGRFLFEDHEPEVPVRRLTPRLDRIAAVLLCLPADVRDDLAQVPVTSPDAVYAAVLADLAPMQHADEAPAFLEAVAAATSQDVTTQDVTRTAEIIWQHRPVKGVDQSREAVMQDLMRRLFTHYTGADPARSRTAPPRPDFAGLCDEVRLSRGEQAIHLRIGQRSFYNVQGIGRSRRLQPVTRLHRDVVGQRPMRVEGPILHGEPISAWGYAESKWDESVFCTHAAELAAKVMASRARVEGAPPK